MADDESSRFGGTKVPEKSVLEIVQQRAAKMQQGPAPARQRVGGAPAPRTGPANDGGRTQIARHSPKARVRLQRIVPAEKAETIPLSKPMYVLGRSNLAEIPLHSPGASRQHAKLINRDGKWFIDSIDRRLVKVNDTPIKGQTRLTGKSKLQLGEDILVFYDDDASAPASDRSKSDVDTGFSWKRISYIVAFFLFVWVVIYWFF